MKQTFRNFRFNLVKSDRLGYHKVKVGFVVDNKRHEEYLFIADKNNKNNQYYIDEAMKQVEAATGANFEPTVTYVKRRKRKANPNQPVKQRKRKYYGDRRPLYICSVIMGLVALTFGSLFVWKLLSNMKKSRGNPGEKTTISLDKNVKSKTELSNYDVIINQDYDTELRVSDEEKPYIRELITGIYCGDDRLDVDYTFTLI